MSAAYVAMGSSIDPSARLLAAAQALRCRFPDVRFSSCYRSAPVGFEGDDFLNAVATFSAGLPVAGLIAQLHEIEEHCGRSRADPKWGPRAMDLDLLLYGERIESGPGYTLPRPDLLHRAYMLGPLAELSPELAHPVTGERFGPLWEALRPATPALSRDGPDLNAG